MAYVLDVQKNWLKAVIPLSDYCAYISLAAHSILMIIITDIITHLCIFKSHIYKHIIFLSFDLLLLIS
jgi:hypothetical protein